MTDTAAVRAAELDDHIRNCDDCMLVVVKLLYQVSNGIADPPVLCADGTRLLAVLKRDFPAERD